MKSGIFAWTVVFFILAVTLFPVPSAMAVPGLQRVLKEILTQIEDEPALQIAGRFVRRWISLRKPRRMGFAGPIITCLFFATCWYILPLRKTFTDYHV